MTEEFEYNHKPLSAYNLWALMSIKKSLDDALLRREEASRHPKFAKMSLPPPNPEFVKLKNAIEEEIRKQQNV
jgi:hypothetical protein